MFVVDYWGAPEKNRKERELKHALFLKFKESASAEEVKEVEEAIAKLPSQVDAVKSFEWGKNNSPEKHDDGYGGGGKGSCARLLDERQAGRQE